MPSITSLLLASSLVGAALVSAQAAPNWQYIPTACSSECAQTIQSAYLCQNQFSGSTTDIYGCFCNDYPSDASTCATCLNSNNAAALATLLTSTQTACPAAVKACFFECSFDTCPSSDTACQCAGDYLENIYNCGSCNTANGNTGATQLTDFQALNSSCANQNFTGPDQTFATKGLPSPTTDGYVAPTLTATGGGAAATGDTTGTDGALAATGDGSSAGGSSASATSAGAKASSGTHASGSATSASKSGASAAASATSSGAALLGAYPLTGLGGLMGLASAILALL